MEIVYVLAGIAVALLLVELLVPTGGALAFLGAIGFVVAGVLALESGEDHSEAVGAGLITAGLISAVSFYLIGRKVLDAHREPPLGGADELIGEEVEVRSSLRPVGQVWSGGALWKARAEGDAQIDAGNRVRVKSVDGLTLVVEPVKNTETSEQGGS